MEPFKEANNGVVLKTSQRVCFDDIFLAVNVAASLGDICGKPQPTFRAKNKTFLQLLSTRATKHGVERRRRSWVTVPFSLPTLGVLGRMCWEDFEMCCEDFEMCCEDFKCVAKILKCVVKISEFVVNLKCFPKNLECVLNNSK